jgi:hypothetical protein
VNAARSGFGEAAEAPPVGPDQEVLAYPDELPQRRSASRRHRPIPGVVPPEAGTDAPPAELVDPEPRAGRSLFRRLVAAEERGAPAVPGPAAADVRLRSSGLPGDAEPADDPGEPADQGGDPELDIDQDLDRAADAPADERSRAMDLPGMGADLRAGYAADRDVEPSGTFDSVEGGDGTGAFGGLFDPAVLTDADETGYVPVTETAAGTGWTERDDLHYGDRVEGWIRPEYHDEPEPVAGEYWTPVPAGSYETEYGWPTPVERLAEVPLYPPAPDFDLPQPEEAEPTALVPQWPPARPDDRIEMPRSRSHRAETGPAFRVPVDRAERMPMPPAPVPADEPGYRGSDELAGEVPEELAATFQEVNDAAAYELPFPGTGEGPAPGGSLVARPEAAFHEAAFHEAVHQETVLQKAAMQEAALQQAAIQEGVSQEATFPDALPQEAAFQEVAFQEGGFDGGAFREAARQEVAVEGQVHDQDGSGRHLEDDRVFLGAAGLDLAANPYAHAFPEEAPEQHGAPPAWPPPAFPQRTRSRAGANRVPSRRGPRAADPSAASQRTAGPATAGPYAAREESLEGPIWTVPDLPEAAMPDLSWSPESRSDDTAGRRARRPVRRRRSSGPGGDEATQALPPMELSHPEPAPRARPRPRPRPGNSQAETRSTVYVSRHAAEPS